MTNNAFLFMWCNEGLDCIIPITEYEHEAVLNAIRTGSAVTKLDSIINYMKLRARFNSQRCYEIYAMDCDDALSEDDLRQCFDDDPQGIVDIIRERGIKLHSDYSGKKTKIIA